MELSQLEKKFKANAKPFRKFIDRLEEAEHKGIKKEAKAAEKEVWEEVQCLSCANCCKKMTPTLTKDDRKRIAKHLGLTPKEFKMKTGGCSNSPVFSWLRTPTSAPFMRLGLQIVPVFRTLPKHP
jgi:hypothetical protein